MKIKTNNMSLRLMNTIGNILNPFFVFKQANKIGGKVFQRGNSDIGQLWQEPLTGMEFVFVKGGHFDMQNVLDDGRLIIRPYSDCLINDFYIGRFEVTQGQWEKIMQGNPSCYRVSDNYPVETVSYEDVQEFIQNLNQKTGTRFRLPTSDEWEYAATSGGKREKFAGTSSDSEVGEYAWYKNNSGDHIHPVGKKKPNGLGIYDMNGNVHERVQKGDDFGHSVRGGSFYDSLDYLQVFQEFWEPMTKSMLIGFRLAFSAR